MYGGNQLAKIHIGKKKLCLDDEDYQAFLYGLTGKTSSKDMSQSQRLLVVREMTKLGAFKTEPLTSQQKACVAKWYKLRRLGAVKSKNKSSLNRYIKTRFNKWNMCDLTPDETNQLLGHLEGWINKVEHKAQELCKSIMH